MSRYREGVVEGARILLLPMAGVGIVAHWLVLTEPGEPFLRIDLRRLDRVELGEAGEVVLARGGTEASLYVDEAAAERIVRSAAPYLGMRDTPALGFCYGELIVVLPEELAGKKFQLLRLHATIGRFCENDIVIDHRSISRTHAKITRDVETGRYSIVDHSSSNGVRVNGERCIGAELTSGDFVDLGHVRMYFFDPDAITQWEPDAFMLLGREPVVASADDIRVGRHSFRVDEVTALAADGDDLPHLRGLPATMALLAVAAAERDC
jgi:hypothetical protein